MASQPDDAVYAHIAGEDSSETDEDPDERDEDLEEDPEEEDVNSPSTSSPTAISLNPALSTTTSAAVTVAVPFSSAVTVSTIAVDVDPERLELPEIVQKPAADESRRLFQRLWTDEDEIELLRGFLDYTTSQQRGGGNPYHHDTAAFYEQIKSKLQLDFNKNQLVEKLRRLKKKYRNAVNRVKSGKDISFKSPHDQATFEISRKIWSDTGKIIGFEDNVLEEEETHNQNITVASASRNFNLTNCSNPPNFEVKIEGDVERKMGSGSSNRSRKRSRSRIGRIEEERRSVSDGLGVNLSNNENSGVHGDNTNHGGGGTGGNVAAGLVEETLKSCLAPLLREFISATTTASMMGGSPYSGSQGIGTWGPMVSPPLSILPPFGSHLPAIGFGGMGEKVDDEKWRKQQILELEVYSRRLELVQDQIRLALAELRAMDSGRG